MRIIKSYFAILILVLVFNAGSYALRSFWEHPSGRGSITDRVYEYTAIVVSAAQNLLPHRKAAADSSLQSPETVKGFGKTGGSARKTGTATRKASARCDESACRN
jgi:hypothetical protein